MTSNAPSTRRRRRPDQRAARPRPPVALDLDLDDAPSAAPLRTDATWADLKAYLHRSGRTARAGTSGTVVTLSTPEQSRDVRTLAKQAGINPTTTAVQPGHALIGELVGEKAPYVEPPKVVDVPQQRPGTGAKPGRGRSGGPKARTSRNPNAPARTRKELEARAGGQPARRRSR